MATLIASIVTTLNTRPLAIFKNKIFCPQSFHYHNSTMKPSKDSILLMMKSTSYSIEKQIKDAVVDSKADKINEFQTFKNQLGKLASQLDHMYQALAIRTRDLPYSYKETPAFTFKFISELT